MGDRTFRAKANISFLTFYRYFKVRNCLTHHPVLITS
jgi:hypothetical protein